MKSLIETMVRKSRIKDSLSRFFLLNAATKHGVPVDGLDLGENSVEFESTTSKSETTEGLEQPVVPELPAQPPQPPPVPQRVAVDVNVNQPEPVQPPRPDGGEGSSTSPSESRHPAQPPESKPGWGKTALKYGLPIVAAAGIGYAANNMMTGDKPTEPVNNTPAVDQPADNTPSDRSLLQYLEDTRRHLPQDQ